ILARVAVVRVGAARPRIAAVVGANVVVVAVGGWATGAAAPAARVGGRAGVAVIAWVAVVGVGASRPRAAAVVGADSVVIAVAGWPADAAAATARIVGGAGAAIVTRIAVVGMGASRRRAAAVISARVTIVAVDGTAHARVIDAVLGGRALIAVGAIEVRVTAAADPRVLAAGW